MEKWEAKPLIGVGKIKFGMTRDEVRNTLGLKFNEFKKSKYSKNTTDDFGVCHVFYDEDDKCEAVEIFDDIGVTVNGLEIFPDNIDNAMVAIKDLVKDDYGLISISQSVGITVEAGKMEAILFGKNGYYL